MKIFYAIAIIGMMLAGCQSTSQVVTTQVHTQVNIPSSMYKCNVTNLPASSTLTDIGVGRLIAQQHSDLQICSGSLHSIRKYVDSINKAVSARN